MPLIDKTILLGIADRAAFQYQTIKEAWDVINGVGGGLYFDRETVADDADVEVPLGANYNNLDEQLPNVDLAITRGTSLCVVIGAMNSHFARMNPTNTGPLQMGGWDGYLYSEGERVSWWFSRLFFTCQAYRMLAINVFSEGDDLFANVELAGGPTAVFTDGVNYGNGADSNPANGSNYAGTQLKAKVVTMGASDLDLRLSVKDLNNNPTTIDVTIPASSPVGTEITIGTTVDRFLDVIGISLIPFSSFGTLGDSIDIRNLKERQIAL
jgi:hypothetical protein